MRAPAAVGRDDARAARHGGVQRGEVRAVAGGDLHAGERRERGQELGHELVGVGPAEPREQQETGELEGQEFPILPFTLEIS